MLNCATDHTRRRIILYARVSTERQASDGYSLAQQMEALREHAASEGYEVLEEVVDRGHSGATLQRPGLDHVRRLVAGGFERVGPQIERRTRGQSRALLCARRRRHRVARSRGRR